MAFSFPTSPTLNQTYTFGTKTWRFNGTGWVLVTGVDAAQSAWSTANLAYVNSNAATVLAQGAFDTANSKFDKVGGTTATAVAALGDSTTGGSQHAGWVKRTVGTGGRAGRIQYETLVAIGSISSDASDDIQFRDS